MVLLEGFFHPHYSEPFTAMSGISIETVNYGGNVDLLIQNNTSESPNWDLIDLEMADNVRACENKWLEPLDHSNLKDAPDGTSAKKDFLPDAITECGVAQVIYSTVLGFDTRAFVGIKPDSIKDFFDLKRFPGKRGLQQEPVVALEWALRSYGVPAAEIYDLLSTKRGIDLAFRKLDQIKNHIVWWDGGDEPAKLLASGKVVMSSGYNGRLFDAEISQGLPVNVIWDTQVYEFSTWGIPADAPNRSAAQRFIDFATTTQRLADQTKYISYGPARKSSSDLVWKHAESGLDIRPYLPTFPANFQSAIAKDHRWYATLSEYLDRQFQSWLDEEG